MAGGRPTKYNDELLLKAQDYLDNFDTKYGDSVPMLASLSLELNVDRVTISVWANEPDKKQFSNIVRAIEQKQERVCVQNSVNGTFNSTISKLILSSKHGYVEKKQLNVADNNGDKLELLPISELDKLLAEKLK
jgi:hypothetical protein